MLTNDQLALLELLKKALFGRKPSFPPDTDWDAVLREAQAHTVVALAAPAVPEEEAPKWEDAVYQNMALYLRMLYAQENLVKLFAENEIPMVILKGTAAAIYYPEPARRTMGDIDFLVPPERFDDAKRLMERSGYTPEEENEKHCAYLQYGVEYEMHRSFSAYGLDVDTALAQGLANVEDAVISGSHFPMLPQAENGLVLLAHLRQHLLDSEHGLGLRQVVDWMLYVHANAASEQWREAFSALAHRYRLDTLARAVNTVCKTWLGLPDDVPLSADDAATSELISRIMACGNFGAKKTEEELLVPAPQNVLEEARQIGLFRYLQQAGLSNWKAAQRFGLLRPFAWLYQCFRYLFFFLAGGRRLRRELKAAGREAQFKNRIGV